MSASRRLLGLRNVSFAPQLGIKGLVSELSFHVLGKYSPSLKKWTSHDTAYGFYLIFTSSPKFTP